MDRTPIASRASTSSLMRIAPSCAVNPAPTVAERARPATSGAISRVLKYAEMKPVKAAVPIWLSAAYPWRPTTVPVNRVMAIITPIVPPMTPSPPLPNATSARSRCTSLRYLRRVRGIQSKALM